MKKSSKVQPVKSPLRYPGGKSRAVKQIMPLVPEFEEFREPMVGGGSVFFALKQKYPDKKFWINDINNDLYLFWKNTKDNIAKLEKEIRNVKENSKEGKELHRELTKNNKDLNDFEKAVRFFVLNRITFSGLADCGGFSQGAFHNRFTHSSIDRLKKASEILDGTKITNQDYEDMVKSSGNKVFIFLDPPYLSKTKSKLYGKNGDLHEGFDHKRFAETMKNCKEHKWLVTYDDDPNVIKLFQNEEGIYLYRWQLQYGMNNYKQGNAAKGDELFISNYPIPKLEDKRIK